MKKYTKVLVFAAIVALIVVPAHAAVTVGDGMCGLIVKMQDVFKTLRILAFVGAGFYMAGWAWNFIIGKGGDGKGGGVVEDIKGKGIGLLVGFTLLFAIGVVISFLLSATNGATGTSCLTSGWN